MDQVSFLLEEIQKLAGLSDAEFESFRNLIEEHRTRMLRSFPNYDLFITGTGQSYGLKIEKRIIESFKDLTKLSKGSDYDAKTSLGEKVEIKSIKAISGAATDYIGARIVNLSKETESRVGSSFQQVKPSSCDWFIFHILYGNAERIFIVPSKVFSAAPGRANREAGRILLSGQHRGHTTEGQVNSGQILSRASYFEPSISFSSQKEDSFSFEELKKEVEGKLNALGEDWILPED